MMWGCAYWWYLLLGTSGRHTLLLLQHQAFGHTMLDNRKLFRVNVLHCYHATLVCTDPDESCVEVMACYVLALCRD